MCTHRPSLVYTVLFHKNLEGILASTRDSDVDHYTWTMKELSCCPLLVVHDHVEWIGCHTGSGNRREWTTDRSKHMQAGAAFSAVTHACTSRTSQGLRYIVEVYKPQVASAPAPYRLLDL